MQIITICGNLAEDAIAKARKDDPSKEFIAFKVMVNETYGNEKTTTAFDVIYSKTKIFDYLKKGQKVIVVGDLTVTQNTKDGITYTNLSIRPHRIELAGQAPKGNA